MFSREVYFNPAPNHPKSLLSDWIETIFPTCILSAEAGGWVARLGSKFVGFFRISSNWVDW